MASKTKNSSSAKKSGRGRTVMMLTICLPLAFFLKSAFVFIMFGMMPTLVAYYVDTSKEKMLFRVVALCNVSGVLPYAVKMIMQHSDATVFQHYFLDIKVWFVMYASAALGWLMVKYLPALIQSLLEISNQQRINSIEKMNHQLVEEWGPDIQRTE